MRGRATSSKCYHVRHGEDGPRRRSGAAPEPQRLPARDRARQELRGHRPRPAGGDAGPAAEGGDPAAKLIASGRASAPPATCSSCRRRRAGSEAASEALAEQRAERSRARAIVRDLSRLSALVKLVRARARVRRALSLPRVARRAGVERDRSRRGHARGSPRRDRRARSSEPTQVLDRVALVPVDDEVLTAAAGLDPATLRSLDAIHIATALSCPCSTRSSPTTRNGGGSGPARLRRRVTALTRLG